MNSQNTDVVALFGGNGNMGKRFVSLFQQLGYTVLVVDPSLESSVTAAEAIRQASLLYFSVFPIESIATILQENRDALRPSHKIIDNATLKASLISLYHELDEKGISICSTHPMIKHDQALQNVNVLLMPVGENSQAATVIARSLHEQAGMILQTITIEEHDQLMVCLQLIPHLIMRVTAAMFEINEIDVVTLSKIAPANFQLFLLSMFRTVIQDPKISAKIIASLAKSPEAGKIISGFQEAFEAIMSQKSEEVLADLFEHTAQYVGHDNFLEEMNERTSIALERLTNLSARSIIIECDHDTPGLLLSLLTPFEKAGINLTAIDSHKEGPNLRFEIGVEQNTSKESLSQVVSEITALGHSVHST